MSQTIVEPKPLPHSDPLASEPREDGLLDEAFSIGGGRREVKVAATVNAL
jgi:hypothetical protein